MGPNGPNGLMCFVSIFTHIYKKNVIKYVQAILCSPLHLKSGQDQSEAPYESWRSSGRRSRGMDHGAALLEAG